MLGSGVRGDRGENERKKEREWTVREVLAWTRDYLRKAKVDRARFEAELLLAHALGTERLELYLHPERVLTPEERARFRELIQRRRAGEPLQYLLGEVEFMGLKLKVNEHVLIPRPETEGLVELVLQDVKQEAKDQELKILDLGTGSGAIAIALAQALPRSRVLAVDISAEALALAAENAQRNGIGNVEFRRSDWFSNVVEKFEIIVANPPYVAREEARRLPREVRAEPREAWDGGPSGLEHLKRIIAEAPRHLVPGGRLYLEIGAGQGAMTRELALATGAFDPVEVLRDLAGRERYLRAVRR